MARRTILLSICLFFISCFIFSRHVQASCSSPGNDIERENCITTGVASQSTWDISGAGDSSIQGFADNISYNIGDTVTFRVSTPATSFHFDIYRMGYYQGNGARKVATVTATGPRNQPSCLYTSSTGLLDCGNWTPVATWKIPTTLPDGSTTISGIYFARVIRDDTGGASHIVFIVRNDASHSAILFQASDTSWQAYNNYGGQNVYGCNGAWDLTCRAYKVSYNRPFVTRAFQQESVTWVFGNEYPMIRWLEANGYDVSYFTDTDTDRNGALILNHKLWMSNGHDEYWSGNQRANIEAARNAGVHLAFLSGNTMFWKTRWENSVDGHNTPYRTLVCYKETAGDVTDPLDTSPNWTWTGTWRDPTNSPPADGGRPENAVKGNLFRMNGGQDSTITVPAADGKMRFWRNTTVANLSSGSATLATGTIGAEFDDDEDNGYRPAGLIELSSTSVTDSSNYLLDYGVTYGAGTAIHKVVMYRYPSGAIVLSTGTYRWSWGLDNHHDDTNQGSNTNLSMQQATVNFLADMGIQPVSLQSGLLSASASADTTPPTSTITSPTSGATIASGSKVTIQGTASDTGGGVVGGVEVSTDGGTTWHPASGRASWTYSWTASGNSTTTIRSRAVDDSGNLETPSAGVTVTVGSGSQTCPCTIFGSKTPATVDQGADSPVELGVRFKAEVNGSITGIRFYKSSGNTGTHVGNLWSTSGSLLGSATFTNETASGWQQVSFPSPGISITAGTIYMASYHCTVGHYSEDDNFFASSGYDNAPLHAPQDGVSGINGAYGYSSSSVFPTNDWLSANYYVDVVFSPAPSGPPTVSTVTLNPTSVTGGNSSLATVTLTGSAPSSGVALTFASDNGAATPNPAGLTVPSGQSSATFTVNTTAVATTTTTNISASDGKTTIKAPLTITPVPALSSVAVNPSTVVGGNSSTGTVTLTYPAPSGEGGGGAQITLASDNGAAVVPGSVTVPAGATSATFTITTTAVSSATTANISGTYNGVTPPAAALNINPPPPVTLSSVSVSPSTVVGGNQSTGTVTLSGPAPTNGITVTLTSSNVSVATVQPQVTVLANSSTATFPVNTVAVSSSTPVTITASYGGASPTAILTVTPKVLLAIDKNISTSRSSSGSSITSPTFSTSSANELLLAFVASDAKSAGVTVTGVTTTGVTWSLVKRTNAQLGTAEIWKAFASTALTNVSVKASLSQSVAASITVVTFTGANTSTPTGATGTNSASSGAPSASLMTTHNNSWVFGVGNDWDNAIARTLGPNQSFVNQYLSNTGDTFWVQSMTSPTPTSGTTVVINDTAPTGDRFNLSLVEVVPQ